MNSSSSPQWGTGDEQDEDADVEYPLSPGVVMGCVAVLAVTLLSGSRFVPSSSFVTMVGWTIWLSAFGLLFGWAWAPGRQRDFMVVSASFAVSWFL